MANTALNISQITLVTNKSGGNLLYGDIVVISDAAARSVTTTTDSTYTGPVGVIVSRGGIANNGLGAAAFSGYVDRVNLTASASIGDGLIIGAVAGKATPQVSTESTFAIALDTGANPAAQLYGSIPSVSASVTVDVIGGRLTLTSAVPITSSDVTGAGTLYYTPFGHGQINLYDGSVWVTRSFSETSLSLTITDATNYDVFGYWTGSALALELTAWASATARATALTRQDGILVKSGDATRRYLGTIRASGTNVCEDSVAKRFVWNAYNRANRILYRRDESAVSWVAPGSAWQMANNSSANRVEIVVGLAEVEIDLVIGVLPGGGAVNSGMGVAVGEDSTTTPTNTYVVGQYMIYMSTITVHVETHFRKMPAIGYHFYQWLEFGNGGTFYSYRTATPPDPDIISGMIGNIEG